jgi:dihydrofolate reductase
MKISLIVAMDEAGGIGKNNDLMWHLPTDMQFFKETTKGHIVVMGRKNYDSLPERFRPLPLRENVVLTRNKLFVAPNCVVLNSFSACLEHYRNESQRTLFIIGGGEIYGEALKQHCVDELYITHVKKHYDADTFFPEIDLNNWKTTVLIEHAADERHEAAFTIKKYVRT